MKLISSISALTAGLIFQGEQSVAEASNLATGLGPVALFGIASSMAVLKPASAARCIDEGIEFVGGEIFNVLQSSAADCSKVCRRTDGCKYWTYGPDHRCSLKHRYERKVKSAGYASGDLSCPWHRCLTEGVQLFGEKLRSLDAASALECQDICESDPECVAFTRPVSAGENSCSLMKTYGNQDPTSLGYISGISHCESVDCAIAGHTLEGTPLQDPIEVESLNGCADVCRRADLCAAGTYTPSTKQCVLYDVFKPVAKPGTNAFNLLDCESSTCAGIGVAFEGSDFTNVPAISAMDCQQKCKEDERCHAYSFHIPGKQCYMKPKAKAPKIVPDHVSGLADCENLSTSLCIEDNTDYKFTDIRSKRVENVKTCADECRKDEQCILFTYNKNTQNCILKNPGATFFPDVHNGVTGNVQCAADPCASVGVKFEGTQIGDDQQTANPIECRRICQRTEGCNFYTFSYPNTCKLLATEGTVVHDSYAEVSGPKFCY